MSDIPPYCQFFGIDLLCLSKSLVPLVRTMIITDYGDPLMTTQFETA